MTAEPVGPASAAPPGGEQQSGCLSLCRMAASPYPAYDPTGDHRTRRPGKRSAAGQDDGSVAKEPVAAVDQRRQHGEERGILQRIAKMVGAQRQMGG